MKLCQTKKRARPCNARRIVFPYCFCCVLVGFSVGGELSAQKTLLVSHGDTVNLISKGDTARLISHGDTAGLVSIKGRVVDEKGQGVAGASLLVKGSGRATSTDADGDFVVRVRPGKES